MGVPIRCYEPYGETNVEAFSSGITNPYQYTGRENDGNGQYYYRARYYSPGMKRFTQEDPLGFVDGPNAYAYVRGNPATHADPTGMITSVDMACMQDAAYCWELVGDMSEAKARFARWYGNNCEGEYLDAVAGLYRASTPLAVGLQLAMVPIGALEGAIARKGLGGNPFKGKSFKEIDEILTSRGFKKFGPDPANGRGSYFHPQTGRKYFLDKGGKYRDGTELPHVDVHHMRDGENLEKFKHRYPLGDDLILLN